MHLHQDTTNRNQGIIRKHLNISINSGQTTIANQEETEEETGSLSKQGANHWQFLTFKKTND